MRMSVRTHNPKLFVITSLALTACALVIMTSILIALTLVPTYSTTVQVAQPAPAHVLVREPAVSAYSASFAYEDAAHVPGVYNNVTNTAADYDPESGGGMVGNFR